MGLSGANAVAKFRALALDGGTFEERYAWEDSSHTKAEVESIWDEVVALVPAEATKVLEIGSGSGEFYQKLITARPGIEYLGIDLIQENVEDARTLVGGDPGLFEIGNAWDTLLREDADWDFIVSIHTAFSYTDSRHHYDLIRLIDAKAPKGFAVVADLSDIRDVRLSLWMDALIESSTNVADSYYTGSRAFLDDSLLKGLAPLYINREDTASEVPSVPERVCILKNDKYNRAVQRFHWLREVRKKGNPEPTDFPGVEVAGGRVTTTATKAAVGDRVADLNKDIV